MTTKTETTQVTIQVTIAVKILAIMIVETPMIMAVTMTFQVATTPTTQPLK